MKYCAAYTVNLKNLIYALHILATYHGYANIIHLKINRHTGNLRRDLGVGGNERRVVFDPSQNSSLADAVGVENDIN